MNSVNIGTGGLGNVLAALESIGFTIDESNNAKWSYDTNDKLYFKVSLTTTQTQIILYDSANTALMTNLNITSSLSYKMVYERIGNSIVFGFQPATATGNYIHFAIIEPSDTNDSWLYVTPYLSSSSASKIINGDTQVSIQYGVTSIYTGSANGVQICKYYDGIRFAENLFITSVCSSFQNTAQATASATANNYLEATIGTDTYLIINLTNAVTSNKIAIKKTLLAS